VNYNPYRIDTPQAITKKLVIGDHICKINCCIIFGANPFNRIYEKMGKILKYFLFIHISFLETYGSSKSDHSRVYPVGERS